AVEIRSEDAIEDLLADLEAATIVALEEAHLEAREVREDVAAEGVEPGGARRCVGAGLEPRGHDGAAPEAEAELAFEGVFDERARASHAARGPAEARDGTQRAEGGPRREGVDVEEERIPRVGLVDGERALEREGACAGGERV